MDEIFKTSNSISETRFIGRGWFQETKSKKLCHGIGTRNMLEITPHAGRQRNLRGFDWGVYFPFTAQSLRSKKFIYPQVSDLVKNDSTLQIAIKQSAEQILRENRLAENAAKAATAAASGEEIRLLTDVLNGCKSDSSSYAKILKSQEKRASSILHDMRSTLNNFLLTLTSWLLYKLLPCFLSGVVTHTEQIEMLKTAANRSPGTPLIFLPLHRSHLDYIMVTFILTNNDIRSPLVAAGNNLQIPVFGELLRGLGAFFIKRKIDPVVGKKDILYRAILQLYLQHALKKGHNVEFFIEGGRTRTGKPCMPKGGILSVIVNAFMDGQIPDALLVPVSVNYERLVDGNFVREQKGEKKVPESFGKAMSGIWKTLNSEYGLMRIDFNQPYSIKELVQSYNKVANTRKDDNVKTYSPSTRTLQHNQSTSSLYGTDVVCEEHRNLIDSISREVVFDCAAATSVMSTNALSFLLLTRYRNGAIDKVIAKGLNELRETVTQKDLGFAGDSMHIINYATDLLGTNLVVRTRDENDQIIIKPNPTIESFIELSYYSNMLAPHFALQSILLTTFYNMLPKLEKCETNAHSNGVVRENLIQTAIENCDVFRYEFILHKPTELIETRLQIAVDELIMHNMLTSTDDLNEDNVNVENRKMARQLARHIQDDDESYSDDEMQPDIKVSRDTIDKQRALCEVLAPITYTYAAVAQSLIILYRNPMLETEYVKFVINDITTKVKNGICPYAESISTDSVRNCLKLLEKWSVIEICNQNGLRLLTLGALYETSKDSIKNVVQRITAIMPNYKNGYF